MRFPVVGAVSQAIKAAPVLAAAMVFSLLPTSAPVEAAGIPDSAATAAADVTAPSPGSSGYPDLTVGATGTVSAPECTLGICFEPRFFRHADLTVSVQNQGASPSLPTQVVILTSPGELTQLNVPPVWPGSTVHLAGPRVNCGGNGTLLVVDPANHVHESNEANNTFFYHC